MKQSFQSPSLSSPPGSPAAGLCRWADRQVREPSGRRAGVASPSSPIPAVLSPAPCFSSLIHFFTYSLFRGSSSRLHFSLFTRRLFTTYCSLSTVPCHCFPVPCSLQLCSKSHWTKIPPFSVCNPMKPINMTVFYLLAKVWFSHQMMQKQGEFGVQLGTVRNRTGSRRNRTPRGRLGVPCLPHFERLAAGARLAPAVLHRKLYLSPEELDCGH
jgi:hypothetical protein